jgi:spore coat protein CotH
MYRWIIALVLILAGRTGMAALNAGADLFTNGPLLHLKLIIAPAEVESLQKDHRKAVPGTLWEGEKKYRDVAIHLKGAAGSYRDINDRPAFTLDFNKFMRKQKFHGLSKIHLNNSVQDPAWLDEELCGELFRAAGAPAARATHAILEFNGRQLGVYVVKEGFTKEFLGQYFNRTDGNLYDPGFVSEVSEGAPRISGKAPDDHAALKALLAAAAEPDARKRWEELNQILDVERFISMSVMEVLTVHWDGYGFQRNNYRFYFNPENGKFVFFAHGMDQMFGRGGDVHLGLEPPMNGLISRAVFTTPQGRQRYDEQLGRLFSKVFEADSLKELLNSMAKPIREGLQNNPEALSNFDKELKGLQDRVLLRRSEIARQLKK